MRDRFSQNYCTEGADVHEAFSGNKGLFEIRERNCFNLFKQNKAAKKDIKHCTLTKETMTEPLKFHLFNCDNVYQLSIVEDLLEATKAKLGFEFSVESHNFSLSEMSELSTKTIPAMKMDFAMFVVHAHESVLLINNDNLEHGYAKVYRALLQATGIV